MGIKKFAATLAAVVMAFSCMAVSASAAETATCNNHDDSANGFMKTDTARHVLAVTSGDQIEALPVCGALILLAVTGILVPPRKPAKMIAKSANGKTVRRFCPINWF